MICPEKTLLRTSVLVVLLLLSLASIHAQVSDCRQRDFDPCADTPPTIVEKYASGTSFTASPVTVEFEVQDDFKLMIAYEGYSPVTASGAAVATTNISNPAPNRGTIQTQLDFAQSGTAVLNLNVCDDGGNCTTGTYSYSYAPPPVSTVARAVPVVSTAPHFSDRRNLTDETMTLSYATPFYTTFGQPRSTALVYSGDTAYPSVFVELDVTDPSTIPAHQISLSLFNAAGEQVLLWNGSREVFFRGGANPGDVHRVAAMFDARHLATGVYTYTAVVRSYWFETGLTTRRATAPVPLRFIVVNAANSRYGAGWSIAGASRTHAQTGGVLIEDGVTASYYTKVSCWQESTGEACTFASPDGDFRAVRSAANAARYTRTLVNRTVETYTNGRLDNVATVGGQVTRFGYDAGGNLATITDPAGKVTQIEAGPGFSRITDPSGRTSSCQINTAGDLTRITGPDGAVALSVTYNQHWPSNWTLPRGGTWTLTHENLSPATLLAPEIVVDGGTRVRPKTLHTTRRTAVLARVGDGTSSNRPVPRRDPANIWLSVTDPRGYVTKTRVDRIGNVIETLDPLGHRLSISRDHHGSPLVLSGQGTEVRSGWNDLGLMTFERNTATGGYTQVAYDTTWPHLPGQITRDGFAEYLTYDAQGRLYEQRFGSPEAAATTYRYDSLNRVRRIEYAGGGYVEYEFDDEWKNVKLVRRKATTTGQETTESFTFDNRGNPLTFTNREAKTRTYGYDALSRVTSMTLDNKTETVEYTATTKKVRDVRGLVYETFYNTLGWLEKEVNPQLRTRTYRYDVAGNVVSTTDQRLMTISFTYDAIGRVVTRTADGATTTMTYDNPAGRWQRVTNAESVDELYLDPTSARHVITIGGKTFDWTTSYDAAGRRKGIALASPWSASANWNYSAAGRLENIVGYDGLTTVLEYDTWGRPSRTVYPGGVTATITPNGDELPDSVRYNGALHDAFSRNYTYDTAGRVKTRSSTATALSQQTPSTWLTRIFNYDTTGQLQQYEDAQYTKQWTCASNGSTVPVCGYNTTGSTQLLAQFTYDGTGNRTGSGIALQANSNRYDSFGGLTLAYDNEGNVISKSGRGFTQTLEWNALGQLKSVTTNGVRVEYAYNGLGQRVRRTEGGISTYSLYDGDHLFIEERAGHRREFLMYPGVDRPHSVRHSYMGTFGATHYYLTDVATDVVGLIDLHGNVANRYRYTPFGEFESMEETAVNPLRFKAREYDATTRLYYMRSRWYDPQVARFASEDPAGLQGGANLYAYAANDPLNFRDPDGRKPQCIWKASHELTDEDKARIASGKAKLCAIPLEGLTLTAAPKDAEEQEGGNKGPASGFSPNFGTRWIREFSDGPNVEPCYVPGPIITAQPDPNDLSFRLRMAERREQCAYFTRHHYRWAILHWTGDFQGSMPRPNSAGKSTIYVDSQDIGEQVGQNYTAHTEQMKNHACRGLDRK